MSSQTFRFNNDFLQSRVRAAFEPRKPRNPLLRFLMGALGLGLLALLVVVGAVIGSAMLAAGLVYRLFRGRSQPLPHRRAAAGQHDPRVVEGEFRVVDKSTQPR
ncbi:hypothetical protein ACW7G0_09535 [Lysobacter sp. A286]